MNDTNYDLVIAGAGPAGICAALEASRSGCKTALLGNLSMGHGL